MPKQFVQKYLKPKAFDPKGFIFEGIVWPVKGSKDKEYSVELTEKGFTCDCTGFGFHGYCKHSRSVLERVEQAVNGDVTYYKWV